MYLTPELANDFEAKKVELCDHNRVYCHVSTCSTHFSTDRHKGTLALCPNAHDATCSLCKNKRHEGDCEQDLGRQQVDKMAAQQSWKKCSACSASQSRTAAAFPRRIAVATSFVISAAQPGVRGHANAHSSRQFDQLDQYTVLL